MSKLKKISWGLCLFNGLFLALPTQAGEGLWDAGARVQGFIDLEPGNDYMTGVEVGYSNFNLMAHQLEFKFAYLTSRPEAAFRIGVLREDWYLVSPLWHWNRDGLFDPTFQLDGGYHHYDLENDSIFGGYLQNNTWLFGAKIGIGLNFGDGRYTLHYALGYQQATAKSSDIYTLPFSLTFSVLFL